MDKNLLKEITGLLGPEKASQLFMGEPVHGQDAWILLDHLRKHRYETLLEDEENECYVLVMRLLGKYIYILLKDPGGSRGYLIQAITAADYATAEKLAREEYLECIERYGD